MTSALLLLAIQATVLTLGDALATAERNQPQIRQAHANTEAALARVGEARAPLLPQLSAQGSYTRSTTNSAPCAAASVGVFSGCNVGTSMGGGLGGGAAAASSSSWSPQSDGVSASVTLSQTLWDNGGQLARWRQFVSTAEAQEATERATRLSITLSVRQSYFTARADKELVSVARATLADQDRHLMQTEGFVRVGTQPEISLATARTNRANAQVQLINAENNYEVAKAQLNQAMGVEGPTDYDVGNEEIAALVNEDASVEVLLDEALKNRPEFVSIDKQVQAQDLAIWAAKTAYGPGLTASTQLLDRGTAVNGNPFSNSFWNWSFNLSVSWNLFSGGLTWYSVKEQKANLEALRAQRDLLRQQTRLQVEQARLAVRAAKAALAASDEALINAKEQLKLAEGRYNAGVGNVIELTDAQVAATTAAGQRVQAEYNVSSARAQLMQALGRF
jgi:outer membrane protein